MSLLYEVRGLVRRYGRVTALDLPALGVDELRIHSGQVLTLVGYNGSGKSTLLRLLAFLEEPDEGRIIYHGGEDPRREVSLLLQEPYLLKTTVFENVVLGLKLRGRRGGLEDAYQAAMRQVGFDDPDAMRRRGPNALSGGERQRVALASRLVLRPRALLLDEPTSNVDVRSARAIAAPSARHRATAAAMARPSSVPPTIPRSCRPWAGNSSNWARAGAWKGRGGHALGRGMLGLPFPASPVAPCPITAPGRRQAPAPGIRAILITCCFEGALPPHPGLWPFDDTSALGIFRYP